MNKLSERGNTTVAVAIIGAIVAYGILSSAGLVHVAAIDMVINAVARLLS